MSKPLLLLENVLDIGCGRNKAKGAVGMDTRKLPGVDVVHDLEETPWPMANDSFGIVRASHILEHIKPWRFLDVMAEAWRVLAPNGAMLIEAPYGVSEFYQQDPTHCRPITERLLEYFDPKFDLYRVYEPPPWTIEGRRFDGNFITAVLRVKK